MQGSIVITTKNRRDDLRRAIQSAVIQNGDPQVVVIDDGSTDGTSEMVRAEFPQVTLRREESSAGYIVRRNQAARLATGQILFSIDDDAEFSSPAIVARTLAEFDSPYIGAVAIPFINVNQQNVLMQRAPDEIGITLNHDFIGTAHAVRKDIFLRLDGYREQYFHQGEERDYCLRMLNLGYVVRLGKSDPVLHYESVRRDFKRMDLFGRRNDILYVWYNTPWPYFPVHMLGITALGVKFGFKVGRPFRMMKGLAMGYKHVAFQLRERQPVSKETYKLLERLKTGSVTLDQIVYQLAKGG